MKPSPKIKMKPIGSRHHRPDTGYHPSKSYIEGPFLDPISDAYPSNRHKLFWRNFMPDLVELMPEADH
jgi:hypothetical protein